ncbi:MAG: hypothetical protein A3B89_01370 [Candidatus Buchananbacteria bacterium RIFCSPHIGHO2_02_FULL_40_13]|uniref:Phosphate propanoyltransferase n=1 Tax=Candidatus Buchananbacteria bacterium RIFCSPLOWO2_01_FULL_39_33 TaxID=1797543 RepID=A0A1G1YN93_9BACT|nr:MAG: hypothetical protein A2820_03525 [Candidatus Buchananbacteria bacterium RIFCSPHIGHO2_01_FULL_40_35]OGY50138.1 MAG: hypothetical protein A3B89_01370 [Candidatus Buchananbacteria bacterium RIFCSPHIGHO2_02_FULL_40_13]OGY53120.1 MAG: hypothetical protein A3A02_00185 [Candidatus Buchananbacteria bacterium RIFCSPLOWO2_01_FULL_39_33]
MKNKIKIEISARHCHLSDQDAQKLLGKNYKLKVIKPLSQLGEFASQETITVKTKGGQLTNVRVVGPIRPKTQVEITLTEARKLKINPPIRLSGDIEKTPGAMLIGSKGKVNIKEGIIIAQRHLHCNPAQANKLGLQDGQSLAVKTLGARSVTFHNVVVRVKKNFDLSVHLDTDEGNAALPAGICSQGEIISA